MGNVVLMLGSAAVTFDPVSCTKHAAGVVVNYVELRGRGRTNAAGFSELRVSVLTKHGIILRYHMTDVGTVRSNL